MSKPRYRWWSYVCRMVQDYPKLRDSGNVTADEKKELGAVSEAIEKTKCLRNGLERVDLIRRVYWGRNRLRITEAAPLLYISEATAKRWHGDFIRLVGKCWGFDTD